MGKNHGLNRPMGGFLQQKPVSNSALRGHFVAATGEFVGTFTFLFFAFLGHQMSVSQQTSKAHDGTNSNQTIIFIGLSYGLSLLVTAWTFYRISGGVFRLEVPAYHPAVTVGLVITGALPPVRGLILLPVQIISGICAAAVVQGIIPAGISVVETTLAPNVSVTQGLFLEMFFTAKLVFTVLMLAVEKSKDTFIAPIGIGLALFVAQIAGVYYTGASLNPARSFGPCVVAGNFQSYHWIYWIGPLLGALVSGGYFHFVKYFNYEDANPGQDSAGGDFDNESRSRSKGEGDLENGQRDAPQRQGGNSRGRSRPHSDNYDSRGPHGPHVQPSRRSRDRNAVQAHHGSSRGRNRPLMNAKIESGTMHPGFNNY